MSRTYQTEGIILKSMPMAEADRLLTIISPQMGLIQAIAPGARKPKSTLGGRTSQFVINQMMCLKGRSLDKLLQADVKESFPGLSRNLAKLTTAQYLAELVLQLSQKGHAEPRLYELQVQLLKALETAEPEHVLQQLLQGISQLLFFAGISPEIHHCCRSQTVLHPIMFTTGKGIYFSCEDGGTVIGDLLFDPNENQNRALAAPKTDYTKNSESLVQPHVRESNHRSPRYRLTRSQWIILSRLSPLQPRSEATGETQEQHPETLGFKAWLSVEKILRGYAQHHFERTIQSATLVDSVFAQPYSPETTP